MIDYDPLEPPSRRESFHSGAGQRPEVDSRDLTKGDRVRLHRGREGEWSGDLERQGTQTHPGFYEGTVSSVNKHAVHIDVGRSRSSIRFQDGSVKTYDHPVFGRPRIRHSEITRVERL